MAKLLPILTGRTPYSLRVSVLENCQYSCPYCLPGTVKPIAQKPTWLSVSEYSQIVESLAVVPISKIRFTGGEPLLRTNIFEIASVFRKYMPLAQLSITTNGQHLQKKMWGLIESGIDRINVHIDSLNHEKYQKIMGKGQVDAIVSFLKEARTCFSELKVNVVLQKGVNDDEIFDFIEFSRSSGIQIRFIELMNTGSAKKYVSDTFFAGAAAIQLIRTRFAVNEIGRRHSSDPAKLYEIPELGVKFGLIASDTEPFCANCNRLRLNAQGELRGCLYQPSGVTLGSLLRSGGSSEDLAAAISGAVLGKSSFHPLVAGSKYPFSMAEIGG